MKQEQQTDSIPGIEKMSEKDAPAAPGDDAPPTAGEIRQRMATIRRQINEHSQEVVTQTKELSDWRFYVRRYPWASVTAAAVIGYAIVPKRREASDRELDDQPDEPHENHLKAVITGAVKKAAVAQVGRALGEIVNGFFTADEASKPETEGSGDD